MSDKIERIFISVDMEGISSLVDGTQTNSEHSEYAYYRKLMVEDLNAAIQGALECGVKEVVVSDAHGGMKNIQPEDLNEAAYLVRGTPKPFTMMSGIEEDIDAAMYVGYHAMAGMENAILSHTISGSIIDAVFMNGREIGEFGINAALAGWYGIPSLFVSGDAAACLEAETFVPNISTAVVKWALGRVAAKCLHPNKSRALIRIKAKDALNNIAKIRPYCINEPVEVKVRWVNPIMADAVSVLPYMDRIDGKTTVCTFDDYPTAFKGFRASIWVAESIMKR